MTEGMQVSAMARSVQKKFKNKTLRSIEIVKGKYKKKTPRNLIEFQKDLPLRLLDVIKKGKVIFLFFEKGWTVIVKFGMTGWLSTEENEREEEKEEEREEEKEKPNVIFDLDGKKLFYTDIRQFGSLTFTKDPVYVLNELSKLAPDILDDKIKFKDIQDRIGSTKSIDVQLMDQKLVFSGIGNIIKSEILYDAKIDPRRKGNELSLDEWKKIFQSAKKISKRVLNNIENGKEDFNGVIYVYNKEKDKNQNKVERYSSKDGRVTYWVPSIQK